MSDVAEFLLARIAEDERAALLRLAGGERDAMLAMEETTAWAWTRLGFRIRAVDVHLSPMFNRRRSLKYADHPDYDEAWRP